VKKVIIGMSELKEISSAACHGGLYKKYSHMSSSTKTEMKVSVYLPPNANKTTPVHSLYFLSGLTCTEDNFITKGGAIAHASKAGIALICPDTSPRGLDIEGEHDNWDFGSGAGFYVNATVEKWAENYNMYDYVTQELPRLMESNLPITNKKSIFGHSMGGHGALVCYLKNPGIYQSCSAFSPISNPINCPWGQKAFSGYLGDDKKAWAEYDATELVKYFAGPKQTILIDVGLADGFYAKKQLLPEALVEAAKASGNVNINLRKHKGYDHSYWFIQSFVYDHIAFHLKNLSWNTTPSEPPLRYEGNFSTDNRTPLFS